MCLFPFSIYIVVFFGHNYINLQKNFSLISLSLVKIINLKFVILAHKITHFLKVKNKKKFSFNNRILCVLIKAIFLKCRQFSSKNFCIHFIKHSPNKKKRFWLLARTFLFAKICFFLKLFQ